MTETWRFKDEWLIRGLAGVKGADEAFIAKARAEKNPYISHALVDAGIVTGEQLGKVVELTFKVKYLPLAPENADRFGLKLITEKTCRKYNIIPVGVSEEEIRLAMADPLNFDAQSDVEAVTARRVTPFFSMPLAVDSCLEQLFSSDKLIYDLLNNIETADEVQLLGGEVPADEEGSVTAPVVTLVNSIISQAYRKHSSDIHIEHEEKGSHVRIRVDGVLKNIMTIPRHIATGPLVSRIKIMADLDVSNHMRPQDGRAKLRIGSAEVGLRVSTLPTSYGEKVVMRILDQRAAEVPFEKLGFAPEVSRVMEACLAAPQGMILVTGPTGSGKTTTLYSVLNKTRSEKTNIVTVEDPIEYKLAGINQVQVNEKQGLTFAAVLRSVLRQDPDVIMVGEIRDRETADIAFQAAMTGHLVFSTLHTNDVISTIGRLTDMGLDRFKISPALLAITAQRLVRRLCPVCAERVPESEIDRTLTDAMGGFGFEKAVYRGPGCKNCEGSGYAGRTSLVEILQVTPRIKDLINSGASAAELTKAALDEKNLRTLTQDALWHLSKGHTDLTEISPYLTLEKKTAAGQSAPRPAAPAPAPSSGKLRVMIVDDDAMIRLLLKKFIEVAGFQVIEAVDGEAAITAIAAGTPPDLLVTDINMPRLGGMELVKGIRETLGLLDLPIIMLTTEASDKSQELAFELGADDYIIKPFKGPLVIARINAAMRRAGKLK
ncbi:MAG TPA: type II secretion system protein GspE [Elusimicrobia bacterium]|nr:type II secretion system protein GspE [Elusimicrobiota bacterium]